MSKARGLTLDGVNDADWLLPEGVEEILPEAAARLEKLRRRVLDDLTARGFGLVMPPVMEFVDSLLTGTGEELDTQTYKFMDQHTQRMLGIRADMTPQIARIDAHYLPDNEVNRLCYAGTVLRTRPDQMGGQRELLQVGAEMFGVAEESADLEIMDAMLATLDIAGAAPITLSLGHVGIYRALLSLHEVSTALEARLFDTLLRKSAPDLHALAAQSDEASLEAFATLLNLQGGRSVIETAQQLLPADAGIDEALNQLQRVSDWLAEAHPGLQVHFDLADVFGYRYHTGLKFAAYVEGRGRSIASGGRYDSIGERFGRARPATGFSSDLKSLVKLA